MDSPIALQIRQFTHATFSAVHNDRYALIRVQNGLKRLRTDLGAIDIAAGFLAVMAPRMSMTIENTPSKTGPYTAQLLMVPDALVQTARAEIGADGNPMRVTARGRVLTAFDRAVAYAQDPHVPERITSHAVREVLLWLGEEGIGFGRPPLPALADRLRSMIAAQPDRDWRSAEASAALAISEPTLRRHLAADNTNFTTLLADVRMRAALGLLQTSTLSINRIALEVGYASPSRFAVRFRKRFGLSPSAIRDSAEISLVG